MGPALDNVVVTDLTPTPAVVTPVPTLSEWTLVLLATALGALGLRGRRGRGQ
ncbi:MAG: IPTL-CTERM sorting domain-containing protein [Ottowia sp.]